jgi:hypothetical protein
MGFLAVAVWVASAPLYLYVSAVFESNIKDSIVIYAIGLLAAAATNFHMYDILSNQVRNRLILQR